MTIAVRFPDGTTRNVPGQLRQVSSAAGGPAGSFEQIPINCDPNWKYVRSGDQWLARRRTNGLAILCPPVEEWWRSIRQMADTPPLSSSKPAAKPEPRPLRNAA